ncbi:hypothetical protein GCM10010919_33390 [Alishewanella longhuensis]|uniref:Alginate export domain-containing protein n=1 Tax=Alishewanella longhuensis TaxID=1091037 RepID=A0ABQ3L2F8_9ALTE|nr:hypothetical protein [Alishewanella longhuensis]GHG77627.1 hypothetical protein GCM10010919_33390 [Alishewanella longhuensis]
MKALPVVVLSALPLSVFPTLAANELSSALAQSSVSAQVRYRLEAVDQDNTLEDAFASTLRSRLTVNSSKVSGFSALLQVDNVSVLGGERFNSTVNGNTAYSVVADPKGTDINQALLRYQNDNGTSFSAGRQLVNHTNQRFLGGVSWRQNEQTLDGYRLQHTFSDNINAELGHFYNVNRVFGPKGAAADQQGSFNTALLLWQLNPAHQLAAFGYDFDFANWATRSSRTVGVDYQGKLAKGPTLSWQLALAKQDDAHNAPLSFSHRYHRLSVSWALQNVTLQVGQERLAGNGQSAFQTPLATLHAFSGFADIFLNTPEKGLRDNWLQIDVKGKAIALTLAYHRFDSDTGSLKYGDEWNVSANYPFNKQLSALVKLAYYNADTLAVDTSKVWLMLSYQL